MASTASTGIVFNAKAIDHTGGVLAKITRGITSVGKIAAGVFAGQMLTRGFNSIMSAANELGKLSDVAQSAGVSANEISKMSSAMEVLGIKSSTPEQLATAFQKMAKTTGETGVEGFEKVIGSISQMGTVEERAAAAMATFGKSGMDFLPLIEAAAQNGTSALHEVIETMPGVSDAAADAGDVASDAMATVTNGIKAMWGDVVGSIVQWFDEHFEGGIRTAALNALAYMKYWPQVAWRYITATFSNIGKAYHAMSADWGETFMQLWRALMKGAMSWGKFLVDLVINIGRVVRDFLKQVWSGLNGDGFSWEKVVENANFKGAWETFKEGLAEAASEVNIFDGVEWDRVDTADLDEKLQGSIQRNAKFAANYAAAAVSIAANNMAEDTGEKVKEAAKAAKADFLSADTYRAATMSIRADYGKGEDKTVKAIDRVKSINEKIQSACEGTEAALANLGVV